MTYPKELLPNPQRSLIVCELSEHFLLRKTSSKDIIHISTGLIKEEFITDSDNGMFEYSTNLFGHFEIEHLKYNLDKSPKKKYFHSDWELSKEVIEPTENIDFYLDTDFGYFFIPIAQVAGLEVPFKKGDSKVEYICRSNVEHCPTNSNFWHFEIRWFPVKPDEQGQIVRKSGSWQKYLSATIKARIRNYFLTETPEITLLSESSFSNN